MTSISLITPAMLPPTDSLSISPQASPRSHRRAASRNPTAAPLPLFSFNPGVEEAQTNESAAPDPPMTPSKTDDSTDSVLRRAAKPPPLPTFKFNPGAEIPSDGTPSPTHPVLQEMQLNQQRVSRSARPAPLPTFTFGSIPALEPSPSPTRNSFNESSRAGIGHRRKGSEFVGGGVDGAQLIISGSPEKSEFRPGLPITAPARGHAHRRSQAVSISDIDCSELIKANAIAKARAASTPTTPSDGNQQFNFPQASPSARHSATFQSRSPPSSPQRTSMGGFRPRVGFADHVDVIPRPLSLISSETEGSTSTIRYGHSLSGSINSIASPSPRPLSMTSLASSPIIDDALLFRPHTADATTLLSPRARLSDLVVEPINLSKRPLSATGSPFVASTGSPPSKKKQFWFSDSASNSPVGSPSDEVRNPLEAAPELSNVQLTTTPPRPKTSPERTASTRKRKYHTWTAGIFSKKHGRKGAKAKHKRSATPPTLIRTATDQTNAIFDADNTIVIRDPSPESYHEIASVSPRGLIIPSWDPNSDPITSPVLDLDAALGPFGSEEKLGGEMSARTAAARIARLHSSERRGNMDAFGGIHRRTESAPSMPAVSRSTFSMHRLDSATSASEDVFDEEEEDNFLAGEGSEKNDIKETDTQPSLVAPSVRSNEDENSGSEVLPITPNKSSDVLGLALAAASTDPVLIIDPEDNFAQTESHSSKSTIDASGFPEPELIKRPATSPTPFAYPSAPQSHYASSTEGRTTSASMVSSPDLEHVYFENTPRTQRYLGEPGSEYVLRASNDDLPSLSDSISSGVFPRISSSAQTRSSVEQRSMSLSNQSPTKSNSAWKRASLASLNRLIPGSSNGSRLKFETMVEDQAEVKSNKKKPNRLSRLMHFWRSKERGEN